MTPFRFVRHLALLTLCATPSAAQTPVSEYAVPETAEPETLSAALSSTEELSTLLALLEQTGISPDGPLTVLAPSNSAFEHFAAPDDPEIVKALLLAHVAPQGGSAIDLVRLGSVPTLGAVGYRVEIVDGVVTVGNGRIVRSINCRDGSVVHVVDQVLRGAEAAIWSEARREEILAVVQTVEDMLDRADGRDAVAAVATEAVARLAVFAPRQTFDQLSELVGARLDAAALDREVRDLIDAIRFEPVREAAMPPNFPPAALVDEVVLKSYPRYRMAVATVGGVRGQNTSFFTLFNHIKKNEVEMTAPVQMDYDAEAGDAVSMAFLYETADQGETGTDGKVRVLDVEPVLALSAGARGYETAKKVDELRSRLLGYLATHPELEVAGPMRTMGYNSPMVPGARRFYEVELPVRRRAQPVGDDTQGDDTSGSGER